VPNDHGYDPFVVITSGSFLIHDLSQRAEMLKVEDFIVLTNEYEATYTY
jgi:hypothetical protein